MMTKDELRKAIKRFLDDPNRVISEKNFCELAGIDFMNFREIFHYGQNFSPMTQLRCERALKSIEKGEVMIVQKGRHRVIEYRRGQPRPDMKKGYGLTLKGGRIGLKIGLTNASCYTGKTFEEEIDGNS